jgi:CHAD domain-containing protein
VTDDDEADSGLEARWRSDRACAAVLRTLADTIEAHLPGVLADADVEALHDLRVAVRRSRSVLKQMREVFPSAEHERYRSDLKWVQEVTGPTRDLDVLVLAWGELVGSLSGETPSDADPLHRLLVTRRAHAQRCMASALRSERFEAFRLGWPQLLARLEVGGCTPPDDAEDASRPIGELAATRVRKVYGRMVDEGGSIDTDSPAEALHELRKRGKELRYLLELFGELYDRDVVDGLVAKLKRLQDVLGLHQDRHMQATFLRELAPALEPHGARVLVATGIIVARLEDEQRGARDEFATRFAAFSKKKVRRRVAAAFD